MAGTGSLNYHVLGHSVSVRSVTVDSLAALPAACVRLIICDMHYKILVNTSLFGLVCSLEILRLEARPLRLVSSLKLLLSHCCCLWCWYHKQRIPVSLPRCGAETVMLFTLEVG